MTPKSYQFQYHTGRHIATFMVAPAGAQERDNAFHVYIEEDENISEFYAVPHDNGANRRLVIYRAITDLPIWLHSGNLLSLIMQEIDKIIANPAGSTIGKKVSQATA